MALIPNIGVKGLFHLLPPYDTQVLKDVAYTCVAIRRMSDILVAGGDPFNDYYTSVGLSEDTFKADLASGVCIISLQAAPNIFIYVPSSYIVSFPDIGGIPYTTLLLGINLGAVPDSMDLSYLKNKIAADVLETLGIESEVTAVAASLPMLLSTTDSAAFEAARRARIGTVVTDYSKYLASEAMLASARQRITELEAYIRAHPPAPPTP